MLQLSCQDWLKQNWKLHERTPISWTGLLFDLWSLIINESPCQTCPLKSDVDRRFLAGEDCIYEQIKKRERKRNTKKYCLFCEMFSSTRSDAKWSEAWLHVIYGPNLYVFVARELEREREKKENEAIMRAVVSLDLYLCRLVISRLLRFFSSLEK